MTASNQHRPCPKCGGEDRFYLVPAPRTGSNPYWKCRKCDYWESEGKARMTTGTNPTRDEPMTPEVYAESHGATWADFEKAGCSWVKYPWRGRTYDAIRFPEGDGGRIRLFGAPDKWVPEAKGQKPVLWGLTRAVRIAQRQGASALFLVNGHSSVIPLQAAGIPALCVPGGEGNTAGYLRRGLLDELRAAWLGPVVVVMDGDATGRKAAPEVVAVLRGAGATTWSVDPGEGMDAADALRLRGADAFMAWAEQPTVIDAPAPPPASASAGGRYHIATIPDLRQRPQTSWLFKGEIPADVLVLLWGQSQVGKSFIAVDYGMRYALAHPDRSVIYVAPEGGHGYRKRIDAWLQHWGGETPANFYLIEQPVLFMDPDAVSDFIAQTAPLNPGLMFVDTLSRCAVGGDENSNADMSRFLDGCDRARSATGATMVIVHHPDKAGKSFRGASCLFNNPDTVIECEDDDGLVTIRWAKQKDAELGIARYVRRTVIALNGEFDEDGKPVTSCVMIPAAQTTTRGAAYSSRQIEVLRTLAMGVFTSAGAKGADLMEILAIPKKGLYRAMERLLTDGLVEQASRGDPFKITDDGRRVVSQHEARSNGPVSPSVTPVSPSVTDTPTHFGTESSVSVTQCHSPVGSDTGGDTDTATRPSARRLLAQGKRPGADDWRTEESEREFLRRARNAPPPPPLRGEDDDGED